MQISELKSNPFDKLTQSAIEFARTALFFNERFKNENFSAVEINDLSMFEMYFEKIRQEFEVLNSMSKDDLESMRKLAYCNNDGNLYRLNDTLFKIYGSMRTEMNESFPFVSVDFEKYTLGEDSDEFKRRVELRNLCDSDINITKSTLGSCHDYITRGEEECRRYWSYDFTDEFCAYISKLINDNHLVLWELDYMYSYISHRKGGDDFNEQK